MDNYERRERNIIAIILLGIMVVILIFVVGFVGTCISSYNNFVDKEEDVKLARANVENMMQRRLELIPDLVETVIASTEHEKAIVESIANASSTLSATLEDGTVDEITEANTEVSRQINNVLEVARKYPEIKTGEQFISLMDQIEGSINRISVAREEYNEEISSYNKMVKRFPGNILAGIFGYEEMEQFEADEEAKKTILIDWTK